MVDEQRHEKPVLTVYLLDLFRGSRKMHTLTLDIIHFSAPELPLCTFVCTILGRVETETKTGRENTLVH